MANSVPVARGKRERLVEGARALFHEQGVHSTTLADVAARAEVPLGNVYYYFKTKRDLLDAVLEGYREQAGLLVEASARARTPQGRLKALVQSWVDQRDLVARYGCPMGTLGAEIGKSDEPFECDAKDVFARIVDWAEGQFRELGRRDAHDLALSLVAGIQGAALLAQTFDDPSILARQGRILDRWIDSLAG